MYTNNNTKYLVIADCDQLFIDTLQCFTDLLGDTPILVADHLVDYPFASIYAKFGASFVMFNMMDSRNLSFQFLYILRIYLVNHMTIAQPMWTIDQLALLHVYSIMNLDANSVNTSIGDCIHCGPPSSPGFHNVKLFNQAGETKMETNSYTTFCQRILRMISI